MFILLKKECFDRTVNETVKFCSTLDNKLLFGLQKRWYCDVLLLFYNHVFVHLVTDIYYIHPEGLYILNKYYLNISQP